MLNRRDFLLGSSVAAVGATLGATALRSMVRDPSHRVTGWTKDRFLPFVNAWFDARTGAERARIQLVEVVDRPGSPELEQFSLRFRGPSTARIAGLAELSHPSMGAFPLYLGAAGAEASRAYYAADFSLLRDPRPRTGRI
jgi:hypothetical protein